MQQRDDIMSVDAMMDERYGKVGTNLLNLLHIPQR